MLFAVEVYLTVEQSQSQREFSEATFKKLLIVKIKSYFLKEAISVLISRGSCLARNIYMLILDKGVS